MKINKPKNMTDSEGFEGAGRRHPHGGNARFVLALMIFFTASVMVIIACAAIGWRYTDIYDDCLPEKTLERIIADAERDGWGALMAEHMTDELPAYEDRAALAAAIADKFEARRISYIRLQGADPRYVLFERGERFAEITLKADAEGILGATSWSIGEMTFEMDYFKDFDIGLFELEVIIPKGAELKVNGVAVSEELSVGEVAYPALLPSEQGRTDIAASVKYVIGGLLRKPTLEATLGDVPLGLCDDNGLLYFKYPTSATKTVSVTVPVHTTVTLDGHTVDGSWQGLSITQVEAELGDADIGGSGQRPMLDVYTLEGLFAEPEVEAYLGEEKLKLESGEGGKYIFEIPKSNMYEITVIVPASATVKVNGSLLSDADKVAGGATNDDLSGGQTVLGGYSLDGLYTLGEAFKFDKYVISGYLVIPTLSVTIGESELSPSGETANGYKIRYEYDVPPTLELQTERINEAKAFALLYLKYISEGGDGGKNVAALEKNYAALKALMVEGSEGYSKIMESYREVYSRPNTATGEVTLTPVSYVVYSDIAVSVSLDAGGTRINILLVKYKTGWRVWDYTLPA